ncbi:cation/H(+) antiporter 15-like [Rutidosis leptorrhynchoides]|uniref:cation/H(+) antiporter 15-like n=1 Tax=Rutidosis leptorrhynchoides TaxID=125765 RepID=UPI003A99D415
MDKRLHSDGAKSVGSYTLYNVDNNTITTCYIPENINFFKEGHSPWSIRPMTDYFPLLVLRFCLIILFTRIMNIVLKPLKAPPFVANVIGGILLGPGGVFSWNPKLVITLLPFEGNQVTELVSNLALTYYMFLVGLEMDLTPIFNVGAKAVCISLAGILPPIAAGIASMFMVNNGNAEVYGSVYWAIALTVTSFPDVARLLSDLKLMQTEVGKTALIAALLNDIASWTLLVVAITVQSAYLSYGKNEVRYWLIPLKVVPTLVFIPFCWFVLRPLVSWLIKYSVDHSDTSSSHEDKYTNLHVYFVITAVALFGFITDFFGSHSMAGAFMLGLIIPPGELGTLVMEKIEDFTKGILLPIFFLTSGTRFNILTAIKFAMVSKARNLVWLLSTLALSFSVKIISTFMVSMSLGFEISEGFTLGVLMNTKGVLALIVVNAGRNLAGFDQLQFTTIVSGYLLMTVFVVPLVNLAYKPAKRFLQHSQRTLVKCPAESELRLITCVHSMRSVTALTNFLQALNPTRRFPINVFPLRLVELTGRLTAMLIVHDTLKSEKSDDHEIINAFLDMEDENAGAFIVRPLTVVSAYSTMHQDIINLGEDEHTSLIIIPFHKHAMADGRLDEGNPSIREVNLNLLESAPCSVGILVDRGHGSLATQHSSHQNLKKDFCIAMIFLGGPDCREALACAWRMAKTPGIALTVVRYVSGSEVDPNDVEKNQEKLMDDAYINEFRFKTMRDDCILYLEKQVNNVEETVQALNEGYDDIDLYIVGRGRKGSSPLTLSLEEWCEYEELGLVADVLLQSEIPSSILVVKQYTKKASVGTDAHQAFVNHRNKDDNGFYFN